MAEQLYARFDPRHYRIDVRQAPLLRASIAHDEAEERWLMMLLLHHLASDHNTMEVMQERCRRICWDEAELGRRHCRSGTWWRRRGWG